MLIVVVIGGNNRINNLKNNLSRNQCFISGTENENNQTVKDFNVTLTELNTQTNPTIKEVSNLSSKKNAPTIEHLNKTFIECKKERSRINNHWT